MVFLHEGLGSIRQWQDFPENLCNSLQFGGLVYDRYGYGLSDQKQETCDVNFMHEEGLAYLPELVEKLQINNKIILVGHSDGASIALIFASKFSDKLLCVISEAAHVVIEDISRNGIRNFRNEFLTKKALQKVMQIYHGDKFYNLVLGWTKTLLSPEFKEWNIEKLLQKITVPVLAIQGSEDEYGSFYQSGSIKKNIPAPVELLNIEGCGHIPHFQKKDITLNRMVEFIANI